MTVPLAASLLVWLAQVEQVPNDSAALPRIAVDDCVDADRTEIIRLVEIELSQPGPESADGLGADASKIGNEATSLDIVVSCTAVPDLVSITDARDPTRPPRLLDLRAQTTAARRARARELALVIGEYVRAREVSGYPPSPHRARVDVATPVGSVAVGTRVPAGASGPPPVARMTFLAGAAKYSGGLAQLGVTADIGWLLPHAWVIQGRVGAHAAPSVRAPDGKVTIATFAAAAAIGMDCFPTRKIAGLVALGRLELDWIAARGTANVAYSDGRARSGIAVTGNVALSPWLRLGKRTRLVAEPSLLVPLKSLSIEDRGSSIASLSGIGASFSMGFSVEL